MVQTPAQSQHPFHTPVMIGRVVDLFAPVESGVIVDATLGGGGHASALLHAHPDISILGIDRDPEALLRAPEHPRLLKVQGNFADLQAVVARELASGAGDAPVVGGVLVDLGVSSHQLDRPERGFSYHRRGPLDMRMGPDAARTAATIVNEWPEEDLVAVFRAYGEERYARRIARAIVAERPIDDTEALAATIASAVPAPARRARHPARRVFQAIRIAVNEELDALTAGLEAAIEIIDAGGRLVVISYHSLEDRIVKRRFAAGAESCTCPPDLPVCVCETTKELRLLTRRALRPDPDEVAVNPRSRSALLRAVEKVVA